MISRRAAWMGGLATVIVAGLSVVGWNLLAAQAQGNLAQAPLNNQVQTPPAFIMAVDDSGSMTFQTQFPGADGEACWNGSSFFDSNGNLNTSGTCDFQYVLPGARAGTTWGGIPPLDAFGFARSAAYNPTYFDPSVKYDPWVRGDGTAYGDANPTATLIDPRGSDSIDLSNADFLGSTTNESFRVLNGMVLPVGTRYRYSGDIFDRTVLLFNQTWIAGTATIWFRYRPATFFTPYTSDSDPYPEMDGASNVYANVSRTRVTNACGTGCSLWKYSITNAANNRAALQNFANWYSYYGNRNRAMIAGMTRSLATVNNLRVGYFRINQNASFDSTNKLLSMRDMSVASQKNALYTDMIALTASGGTPNRQAVNSAGVQFTRTDSAAPVQLACQKNAVMLFTDGFSNGDGPDVGGNVDGSMGIPFRDGFSNTMADIASRYYLDRNGGSPLRPDLAPGLVPVPQACSDGTAGPRVDCQANLHMNFYGVTLGARGNLFIPEVDQDPYTDESIYNNWPSRQNDNRTTVDDIWHASVNTRGEYINARTPADITAAMRRVLSSVTAGASGSGTRGISGARIGAGSLSVAPDYTIANEGTDWYSTLRASRVTVNATTRAAESTEIWEASARLPQPAARSIIVNKAGTVSSFDANAISLADLCTKPSQYSGMSRCTAAELTALGVNASSAIAYLRGDISGEKRNGGRLRDRGSRLGDIVNSSPVVSAPTDDYGYRRLGGDLASSYQTYLTNKRNQGVYRVFVGANDGMLHAFNGGLDSNGNATSSGGAEVFAYVPSTALGHMGNLLFPYDPSNINDQKFDHRYYVDGQVSVGDTRYGNAWSTTLVGGAGAGGRSVFALDVTPGRTFGTNSRLWEISDLDLSLPAAVRNNIGHVLAKPVIVPVMTSSGTPVWRAVFGNGYNSANGRAVLFMVDIARTASGATPTVTMIEAVETAGTSVPTGSNGLGSIVVLDRKGTGSTAALRDGYADTAYGVDQKGAVWKFDLTNPPTTTMTVPLFTTRSYTESGRTLRQPITSALTVTTGRRGGQMLLFGTGSFSFVGDAADVSVQSLYGVEDTAAGDISSTLTRSNLTAGTLTTTAAGRSVSMAALTSTTLGWYIDLPAGERFLGTPTIASGIVFMPTYVPSPEARGCSASGSNWLYALNTLSGAPAFSQARVGSPTGTALPAGTGAVALPSTGSAPVRDVPLMSLPRVRQSDYVAGQEPPPLPPGGNTCWMIPQGGTQNYYVPYPCGRQSWRQIQ